jgi:hypothetical protein
MEASKSGQPGHLDWEKHEDEVAVRLCRVRGFLKLTQTQFASQLSITRERLATYEDGRTPLRCDVGIRLCRHFFINEYWLAWGCINPQDQEAGVLVDLPNLAARRTVALGAEQGILNLPPGISFGLGFEKYLRPYYLRLAAKQDRFPRIVLLPNDGVEYQQNAIACMFEYWKEGLSTEEWDQFFMAVISSGNSIRKAWSKKKQKAYLMAVAG